MTPSRAGRATGVSSWCGVDNTSVGGDALLIVLSLARLISAQRPQGRTMTTAATLSLARPDIPVFGTLPALFLVALPAAASLA